MSDHVFKWAEGNLQQGFASYAAHLGIHPSKAVFINSLVVDPKGPTWRMTATDDLEGVSTSFVLGVSGPGATALHFPLTRQHQEYVQKYLSDGGQLIPVMPVGEGRRYPEASIITALNSSQQAQSLVAGKTIVNSYVTEEVEALAKKTGAHTLMSQSTFIKFVGKEYLHQIAATVGFDVPPGVVISQPNEAFCKAAEFRDKLQQQKIDPDHTKVWIKPTSLSGGQGVVSKPSADMQSVSAAFAVIAQAYKDCGFYQDPQAEISPNQPFAGISKFMPIVIEADVGKIPGAHKKLDDVNINAIISDKGVTFIEATPFDAPDGEYVGSRLPQAEDEKLIYPAKVGADKLFQHMWKEGYRGYVGVDAILVQQNNGEIKAYLNDINARLCGATPLIGLAHKAEAKLGYRPHAYSTKVKLPLPEGCADAFEVVSAHLAADLYKGQESGYTGVVPTVIDVPPGKGYVSCRMVAIGRDAQHLKQLKQALS